MTRFVRSAFLSAAVAMPLLAQAPPAAPAAPQTPPAAAPAPAAAAVSEYYPLKAGSVWKYRIDENRGLEMKVEKIENGEATIATTAQGRNVAKETVKVTADGIYRTRINELAITPPVKLLALPVKKGDAWDVKSAVQGKEISGKLTVKDDKEKLKTKDGKEHDCVMVDGPEFKIDGTTTKVKMWFAAGKGVVKLSYEVGGQEAALELTEYVEGK